MMIHLRSHPLSIHISTYETYPDSFNGNAKTASTKQYVKQDTPIYDIITLINEDGGWGSAFRI